jgi:hypothetical protein
VEPARVGASHGLNVNPLVILRAGGTVAGPVGLLGTTIHEIGHAVAALVFGLDVDRMVVRSDGSGTTYISGHSVGDTAAFAVSAAGYLGMLAWAALLIAAGRSARSARVAFVATGTLLALGALVWMDGVFAFGVAALLGVVCVVFGVVGTERAVVFAATILGAVLAFSGLSDVASIDRGNVDAAHAAFATGLGIGGVRTIWLIAGFVLVVLAVASRVWRGRKKPAPAAPGAGDEPSPHD